MPGAGPRLLAPLASLIISTAGPLLPLPLAPAAGAAVIVVGPAVVGLAPPAAPSPVLVVVLVGTGSLTLALAGATAASTTALAGSRRPVLITTVWQLLLVLRPTGRASRLLVGRDASMASLNAGWSSMMAADSASCPSRIREASRWEAASQ